MNKIESAWNGLRTLEEQANQKTMIHRLHPEVKLLTTLVFIVIVASFRKYDLTALLPLMLYPIALISLGELPAGYLIKQLWITAPLVLFIGIFNPLFDHTPYLHLGAFTITGGWISFFSILIRVVFTVLAALILIATSGLNEIAAALLKLRVPTIFVVQLLFLFRYLSVLIEETSRTLRAHSLRSFHEKGLGLRVWGSLVGQLLLRTLHRAERIYQAMLCRGFTGEVRFQVPRRLRLKDILYFLGWSVFFVIVRLYNVPEFLGTLWIGVGR